MARDVMNTTPKLRSNWNFLILMLVLNILFTHIDAVKNTNCILPPHPQFGQWTIYQTISSSSPGASVPVGTILEITCKNNYKLEGSTSTACIRGEWKPEVGTCLRTCPSLYTTPTTTVTCTRGLTPLKSCANATDGTRAEIQCAPFYEIQGPNKFPFRICSRGQWGGGLPECVPVCGKKSITKDPTLIVGGFNTTSLEYPWQVALYLKSTKMLICGGTLLNQRTVLTAAHCVTNETGSLQPKELYAVAVGKTYRAFDDPRDTTSQTSSIAEMHIPRQYRGHIQRYFGDIALLVTNKTFVLALNVRPICVLYDKKFHQSLEGPSAKNSTYVSGWGFTVEHKNPATTLKALNVPVVTTSECERSLAEDDVEYLTDDKLCAGFLESGMSVCKGDSGGGLVTKYGDRFYITGVVSIAPSSSTAEGGCDSRQYGLYTRFSYYLEDFVIDIESRFRHYEDVNCSGGHCSTPSGNISDVSTRTGCILPNYPKYGNWSVVGASSTMPGMLVAPGTIVKVECKTNYLLAGDSSLFCDNDHWSSNVGHCLELCTDNAFFANCKLVVQAKSCTNKYYAKFCCKSCIEARLIPWDILEKEPNFFT